MSSELRSKRLPRQIILSTLTTFSQEDPAAAKTLPRFEMHWAYKIHEMAEGLWLQDLQCAP
jgi:hypothetical protein